MTAERCLLQAISEHCGLHPKVVAERLGLSVTLTMDVYSHVLPTMEPLCTSRIQRRKGIRNYTAEDIPGELVVTVQSRTNIILNVEINPQNLSKEEAIRHFGEDYEVTRYDFDLCLGDGESAPLYESGTGNLAYIEYRSRGIALLPNAENKIDEIKYVSEPIGASSSKCKSRNR